MGFCSVCRGCDGFVSVNFLVLAVRCGAHFVLAVRNPILFGCRTFVEAFDGYLDPSAQLGLLTWRSSLVLGTLRFSNRLYLFRVYGILWSNPVLGAPMLLPAVFFLSIRVPIYFLDLHECVLAPPVGGFGLRLCVYRLSVLGILLSPDAQKEVLAAM